MNETLDYLELICLRTYMVASVARARIRLDRKLKALRDVNEALNKRPKHSRKRKKQ